MDDAQTFVHELRRIHTLHAQAWYNAVQAIAGALLFFFRFQSILSRTGDMHKRLAQDGVEAQQTRMNDTLNEEMKSVVISETFLNCPDTTTHMQVLVVACALI